MSCSEIDVKGYFLEELSPQEHQTVERHLGSCAECRNDLERLQMTGAALSSLRDEEVPRRIAFVSDKIFEPGWWQRFWQSAPRLGFAAAGMLSLAIVVHGGLSRPEPPPSGLDTAAVEQIVEREVARRLDTAVARAVAATEERQQEKTAELLAAAEKRFALERQVDILAVEEQLNYLRKKLNVNMQLASAFSERGDQ